VLHIYIYIYIYIYDISHLSVNEVVVSIVVTSLPEIYIAAEKNDNEWNILFRRKRKKLFSGRKHIFNSDQVVPVVQVKLLEV